MAAAPLYLHFIVNKGEVKTRTLVSFERPCYSTGQLAKTNKVKSKKHEGIEVFMKRKTEDIEVL